MYTLFRDRWLALICGAYYGRHIPWLSHRTHPLPCPSPPPPPNLPNMPKCQGFVVEYREDIAAHVSKWAAHMLQHGRRTDFHDKVSLKRDIPEHFFRDQQSIGFKDPTLIKKKIKFS